MDVTDVADVHNVGRCSAASVAQGRVEADISDQQNAGMLSHAGPEAILSTASFISPTPYGNCFSGGVGKFGVDNFVLKSYEDSNSRSPLSYS
ncbi:Hypothetical protein NTJ_00737 [Nesidiocoris tenuis]|uniref:Uncharacterized protein n=1 Tax=Nesidiocoris tenuis TaxID=355587 RepID=A0ABN7AAN8_9HEMI|nr:Hypothetical protein NTJ_00737 [Nesidiocoris tenuis]